MTYLAAAGAVSGHGRSRRRRRGGSRGVHLHVAGAHHGVHRAVCDRAAGAKGGACEAAGATAEERCTFEQGGWRVVGRDEATVRAEGARAVQARVVCLHSRPCAGGHAAAAALTLHDAAEEAGHHATAALLGHGGGRGTCSVGERETREGG